MLGDRQFTTTQLVERARGGDGQALALLVQRFLPRLRRWTTGRLPGFARGMVDTDDLVQEAFRRTIDHLPALQSAQGGAFHLYLRQTILNQVLDEVRKARLRRPAPEALTLEIDPRPSPLEEVMGAEALARYEAALARLGESERAAIVMRIDLGCSYAEIAEALGRPSPDAARMAVGRALVRLAREMREGAGRS